MKQLPIGKSDFKKVIDGNYYYIDKSLFIKEVIDADAEILLFPRPRRFGKTLNLSMLRYFFDCNEKDGHKFFENLAIWQVGEKYREWQGKYPVVFLTFKDVKKGDWTQCYNKIVNIIINEIEHHKYLLNSDKLSDVEKSFLKRLLHKEGSSDDYEFSLLNLTHYLFKHFNTRPFLLIDEYDTPIHTGYLEGHYKETIGFIGNLLSGGLKDNSSLEKGIVTGALRISKESIFTDLNNLDTHSVLSNYYSNWFGLTEDEVNKILVDFNLKDHKEKVSHWYNGYRFGREVIYNPWSIINYINKPENGFQTYWINTSSNELVRDLIIDGGAYLKADIGTLINNGTLEKSIRENIVFGTLRLSEDIVWSLLLFSGYLKKIETIVKGRTRLVKLEIPNEEVRIYYETVIRDWMTMAVGGEKHRELLNSLVNGNIERFEDLLEEFFASILSFHDPGKDEPERVYQAFILGMLVGLQDEYEIKSNRESGYGRYDVLVIPKDTTRRGIVIELKKLNKRRNEKVEDALESALKQIEEKKYSQALLDRGIKNILKLGIVADGKKVWVKEG